MQPSRIRHGQVHGLTFVGPWGGARAVLCLGRFLLPVSLCPRGMFLRIRIGSLNTFTLLAHSTGVESTMLSPAW